MLKSTCINAPILKLLPRLGHGDKILIADGNYPVDGKCSQAAKVFLGLKRDVPTVCDVLYALLGMINVEKAEVMLPEDGTTPDIFAEFQAYLGSVPLTPLERYTFYDVSAREDVMLVISTGETRLFSNILLTIGVC